MLILECDAVFEQNFVQETDIFFPKSFVRMLVTDTIKELMNY